MVSFSFIDLQILYLGINKRFNENDIEESELSRLGVGRILDALASLKDRNLIELKKDGSFEITNLARSHLWDEKVPLWGRILRILNVKAFSSKEISRFLDISEETVEEELERLRSHHLVLMSPTREGGNLSRIFEILAEGKEYLEKAKVNGFPEKISQPTKNSVEILDLIDQIKSDIDKLDVEEKTIEHITSKLQQIKQRIQV